MDGWVGVGLGSLTFLSFNLISVLKIVLCW